jgi:hypothetical protein
MNPRRAFSRIWIITLLAALTLAACGVEPSPAAEPSLVDPTGFVTYLHPTGAFSLSLPPDWVVSDTSDAYALNVGFSPPGSPEPLINVYLVSASALGRVRPDNEPAVGLPNPGPVTSDFDPLISLYQGTFYVLTDATYKEIDRAPQPDGSLRIRFLIESPEGTSQHNDFVQLVGSYFVALRTVLPDDPGRLRTLSRIVTTLNVNPASGWASVVPEEEDSTGGDLIGFTNLNAWVDRNGGFVIVGQVVNNAPAPVEFVHLNASLFDEGNQLLLEQDNFVSSDLIQSGDMAPFSLLFSDGLPPGTARYVLEVSGRYADFTAQTFYGPENFALSSSADFDENGALVVSGQVRNEGNLTASLVKVIVTIFDAQQRVIATDTTLVDTQPLAPSQTSTFTVRFFELGGEPNTFLVTAQGIITQ